MKTLTSRTAVIVLLILGLWIRLQPSLSRAASLEVNGALSFGSTAGVLSYGITPANGSLLDPAGDALNLYDGTNYAKWIRLWYAQTNYLGIYGPNNNTSSSYAGLYAWHGNVGIMFGDSDGKLGVGTNSPSAKLDVCADRNGYAARIFNDGNNTNRTGLIIQSGEDTPTGDNIAIQFYDGNGTDVGRIKWDADTISFGQTSDARLKTNVQDFAEDSLGKIRRTRVATYERIALPGRRFTGFIAQELAVEFPEAVFTDVESSTGLETLYITPMKLAPHMFHAIQQLGNGVGTLQETSAGHDARLAALEEARTGLAQQVQDVAKQVQDLAMGVIRVEDLKPGAENTAVVMQLTESVLRQLGVDPWVEIALADAIETVPETNPVTSVKSVTKYRLNLETAQAEPYTVEETVTEQAPTGQTIKRLKAGVRFDETTGKTYRGVGLASADAAQKLAALKTSTRLAAMNSTHSPNGKEAAESNSITAALCFNPATQAR